MVSAATMLSSGNGAQCQAPSIVAAQADWTNLSATAYSAPVTRTTRFGTNTPVVALAARSPAYRGWALAASGAVGSGGTDCVDLASTPRALLRITRQLHQGGVSVWYGYRSLSQLDPTRDQQGLTVGVWQRVRGVNAALDLRALDRTTSLHRNVWSAPLAVYTDSASAPPASRQTITTQAQLRSFDVRTRLQFHAGPVLLDVTGGSTVNQRVRAL
ncbi:MAG TPA: hypothetical protein VGE27_07620, partial [Gemmatimonas sp.]|uniref:hypothetical protein n=1 Tax=Gemmatimonas sp. TaxID=1962908 RepID=UPI002EDB4B67